MSENTIDSSNVIVDSPDTDRETDVKELNKLQKGLNNEPTRPQFKKKLVGGLDEEEVTKYIEYIEGRLKQLEQNNRRATENLYILKNRINTELEEKNKLKEALRQTIESAQKFEEEQQALEQFLLEAKLKNEQSKELENELEDNNNSAVKEENDRLAEDIEKLKEILNQSDLELEQLRQDKDILEKDNTLMKAKTIELENKLSAKDYKINEVNRVCQDIKQELEIEKSCSEKSNMDLLIFKQKIISLEQTIGEKLEELEDQRISKERIEQELALEKSKMLGYRINGFKEELSDMYKKIEALEEEASQSIESNIYFHQQLEIQQNRADKAENDLESFMNLLTGAKEKFYSERNPFGDQISQLVETEKCDEHV